MTASQLFMLVLTGIVIFFYARRFLVMRSVPHYSTVELAEKMETDVNLLLLDVRSNRERQHSHIKGSIHIPLHQLVNRSGELSKHKGKEIICYCQSGNRSLTAASRLVKLGFKAANLKGGMADWNFQSSFHKTREW